jgi:hypothetical protein
MWCSGANGTQWVEGETPGARWPSAMRGVVRPHRGGGVGVPPTLVVVGIIEVFSLPTALILETLEE